MSINYSTLVEQTKDFSDTVLDFAMVHQNSVLTSDAALRVAHLQIRDLQQQIQALSAKNLVILARTEQTEDRLRRGYEGQITDLKQDHHVAIESYRADIDRLITENQFWKKTSLKVVTDLTNMPIQISNLRRDHDVVIKSYCANIERLTADIQRLTNENQFWKNSLLKVGTHLTTVLKQNTRLKEGLATYENRNKTLKQEYRRALLQVDDLQNRLATYKIVSIGVVALCSLYPLASKFCTTETARMTANGAVQLCSALKRGLTGVKADQFV